MAITSTKFPSSLALVVKRYLPLDTPICGESLSVHKSLD